MSLFRNRNNDFEDKLRKQLDDSEFKPAESLWDRIDAEVNREPFENKVQEKVQSYELQPKPETWEAIEAELPPEPGRRRNRRAVWYSMFVLLFVTGMYAGYQLSDKNGQLTGSTEQTITGDAEVQEPASVLPNNNEQPAPGNEASELIDLKETENNTRKSIPQEGSPVDDNTTPNIKAVEASLAPVLPKTTSQTIREKESAAVVPVEKNMSANVNRKLAKGTSSTSIAPAITAQHNNPADRVPETATVHTNKKEVRQPAAATEQQEKEAGSIQTKNTNTPSSVTRNPVNEDPTTTAEKKNVTADQAAEPKETAPGMAKQTAPGSSSPNTTDSVITAKQTLPVTLPEGVKKLATADSTSQVLLTPDKDHAGKFEELSRFSISIMAGAHYSFMHLSAPKGEETSFEKNIALRNKLEAPQMDMSGGFLLDYTLNDNWMVSTGIFFTAFSQRMQYGIATSNGSFVPETGAQYATEDSITNGNQYTTRIRYTWNEIPLLLTYRSHNMGRFNYELRGGVSYAVLSSVDAAIISYDNVGMLVAKDKNAFPGFENSFFMHLHGGVTYGINDKVTIGFLPYFRYSLNSMVSRTTWVQQQPYLIGANLMLRRTF